MTPDKQSKKLEELKARLKKKWEEKYQRQRDGMCELHDCPLIEGKIFLQFGYPSLSNIYLNARENLFPYSNLIRYGGCSLPVIDEQTGEQDTETQATVQYCIKCREIEEEWLKTHSVDDIEA